MTSESEPRKKKFLKAPKTPEVTLLGSKMLLVLVLVLAKCFYTAISVQKKHLQSCNKASIRKSSAHLRNCSPLNRPILHISKKQSGRSVKYTVI